MNAMFWESKPFLQIPPLNLTTTLWGRQRSHHELLSTDEETDFCTWPPRGGPMPCDPSLLLSAWALLKVKDNWVCSVTGPCYLELETYQCCFSSLASRSLPDRTPGRQGRSSRTHHVPLCTDVRSRPQDDQQSQLMCQLNKMLHVVVPCELVLSWLGLVEVPGHVPAKTHTAPSWK